MNQTTTSSCTRKYAQGSRQKSATQHAQQQQKNAQQRIHKLQTRNGKTSASIERATRSCFVGGNWVITSKPFVAKPFRSNAFAR